MQRSHVAGNAYRAFGVVLFIIGALGFMAVALSFLSDVSQSTTAPPSDPDALRAEAALRSGQLIGVILALVVGFAGLLIAGPSAIRYSRRHFIELAPDSGVPSTADPILYLRSFESDRPSGFGRASVTSDEEQLMKALRSIGKPIAIGRPRESLPQIGAPRVYYSDAEWQEHVLQLVRASRLVVIRTGFGDGLRWEVEQILSIVHPEKLLIVVSTLPSLEAFGSWTRSVIRWPSPGLVFRKPLFAGIYGFILFDTNWSPICIQLNRVGLLRRGLFHYIEFRRALKPLLRRFQA